MGHSQSKFAEQFLRIREQTEQICHPLEIEDYVVQPMPFVSPPKWHLAHTTWFFDRFVLRETKQSSASAMIPMGDMLFNSYYKSQGPHWLQGDRGHLSRPTVAEILDYRKAVTEELSGALQAGLLSSRTLGVLEIGLHHEQQHQELLWMDIKYILATNPTLPAYIQQSLETSEAPNQSWVEFPEQLHEFGWAESGFSYDNERPLHRQWIPGSALASRLVTNGEYLEFIEDAGYQRPELWLSDGWDWIQSQNISQPLYWNKTDNTWFEYHLSGCTKLECSLPVSHISYFEADAYARWRGLRLPTEFELELLQRNSNHRTKDWLLYPDRQQSADNLENGLLWQWSQSPYTPYPGFKPEPGAVGEYNGKFMSGQYVLRGGAFATPKGHWRPTYRNFYRPYDRWAFTGLRLAKSL